MAERFLTLAELYDREGGKDRVLRFAGHGSPTEKGTRLLRARETAESEAVSYLGARYGATLPATPAATPESLKSRVATSTLYHLAATNHDQVAQDLRQRYDDVVSWFRAVVRGAADLGLSTAPAVDSTEAQVLLDKSVDDQVFANGGLDDWMP